MDTYSFINSDWTHKIAEFDTLFDDFASSEEWDLWKENPQAKESDSSYRKRFLRLEPPVCDIDLIIKNLRKPLFEMANGSREFDSLEFQTKTNEIKFYTWVRSEMEKDDYKESYNVIYEKSLDDSVKAKSLEFEKEHLLKEIEQKKQRIVEIDQINEESERFREGTSTLHEIKSKVGFHLAMVLVVDFWRSNRKEIKEQYLSLPLGALEIADFILSKYLGFTPESISNLRKQRIEQ